MEQMRYCIGQVVSNSKFWIEFLHRRRTCQAPVRTRDWTCDVLGPIAIPLLMFLNAAARGTESLFLSISELSTCRERVMVEQGDEQIALEP